MRFLHTADWHLGRVFNGISLLSDQEKILREEFLPLVKAEAVEAVIIAGDIYDRSIPPTEAIDMFNEVLVKLAEAKVKVLYIAGNHDSSSRLHFGSQLMQPAGVYVRGVYAGDLQPVCLQDEYGPVYFMLYPYVEPAAVQSFLGSPKTLSFNEANRLAVEKGLANIPPRSRSIAVAHAFIAKCNPSGTERLLSVGGADFVDPVMFKPFNYTALGHLHSPQKAGGENIRYSGSLLKYSFAEIGQKKGFIIGDMDSKGQVTTFLHEIKLPHDMLKIKGEFNEILNNRLKYPATADFVQIELTNRGSIIDAVNRLRQIYPNVMEILTPNVVREDAGCLKGDGQQLMSQSIEVLFESFFSTLATEPMTSEQQAIVNECVAEIMKEEIL